MNGGAFGENFPYTNFHDLNLDWIIKVIKDFMTKYPELLEEIKRKLPKPINNSNGRYGDFLMSDGHGGTSWEDISETYTDIIFDAVDAWLTEHPEATTTVEDNSITIEKLNTELTRFIGHIGELNLRFLGRLIRTDSYASSQGMCAAIINTIPTIFNCNYNYDTTNQRSVITKLDFNGNILGNSDPLPLGHSSDITYNSTTSKLMVAGGKQYIWEVDPITLAITSVIETTPSYGIVGIAYDKDNNQYYMIDTNKTIYKVSSDLTNFEEVLHIDFEIMNQSLEYFNNHLYIPDNRPEVIYEIDCDTFSISNVSKLETFTSGYYPIGETQCISFYTDDGDFIVSGKPRGYDADHPNEEVGFGTVCFAQGNYITNIDPNSRPAINLSSIENYAYITINSDSSAFRPDGSDSAPFKTLAEGMFCLSAPATKPLFIRLLGDFSSERLVLDTVCATVGATTSGTAVNVKSITAYTFTGTLRHMNIVDSNPGSFHAVRSKIDITNISAHNATNDTAILTAEAGTIITTEASEIITNHKYSTARSVVFNTYGTVNTYNTRYKSIGSETYTGNASNLTVQLSDSLSNYNDISITVFFSAYGNWRYVCSIDMPIEKLLSTTGAYFKGFVNVAGTDGISGVVQYSNGNLVVNSNTFDQSALVKYEVFVK